MGMKVGEMMKNMVVVLGGVGELGGWRVGIGSGIFG